MLFYIIMKLFIALLENVNKSCTSANSISWSILSINLLVQCYLLAYQNNRQEFRKKMKTSNYKIDISQLQIMYRLLNNSAVIILSLVLMACLISCYFIYHITEKLLFSLFKKMLDRWNVSLFLSKAAVNSYRPIVLTYHNVSVWSVSFESLNRESRL
jgi:hypothetical protein